MLECKVWPSLILGSAHRRVPLAGAHTEHQSRERKCGWEGRQAGRQGDNSARSVKSLVSTCADEAKANLECTRVLSLHWTYKKCQIDEKEMSETMTQS